MKDPNKSLPFLYGMLQARENGGDFRRKQENN